jgi:hypothetical protein
MFLACSVERKDHNGLRGIYPRGPLQRANKPRSANPMFLELINEGNGLMNSSKARNRSMRLALLAQACQNLGGNLT